MIIGKAISPFALRKKNGGGGGGNDPDAQLFITATGITGTNATATNQLVVDLKAANIWTKMKCIYPFVGNTASSQKYNLKDARDLNAAYRLVFSGGATFSANGIQFNGTNSYADTFFNPSAITNNNHLSYYSRTNINEDKVDIGAVTGAGVAFSINPRAAANIAYFQNHISATFVQVANTDSRGLFLNSRTTSTNQKGYINGILKGTDTGAGTSAISLNIYLGARNNNGTAATYSSKQCAFASIGDGLTDLESQLFYQITEKYQVALGRNINPTQTFYYNTAYNNETNAFLFSTQITDSTIQTATNTLVSDLKTANIFTKMKALYPMVGGTATTCKFNLVNAQDSNAAFRLVFSGGGTFSANGYLPNGVNAYADTFFNPSAITNNNHISYYSRTNINEPKVDMGIISAAGVAFDLEIRYSDILYNANHILSTFNSYSNTDSRGLYINSRTTSTNQKSYKNEILKSTNNSSGTQSISLNMYLGARNNNGTAALFASKECAFASIGDGLTDAEALAYYNAVQTFNTTLSRQV